MRLQILLLIIGTAWADFLPNGCPRDFSVHLLLSHEDCTKFYSCSNGVPIEMRCAPGTAFDFDLQICNWPNLVNCFPTTTDETSPLPTTITPKGCPYDVIWYENMDCDLIKHCSDHVRLKFNCPIVNDYNMYMEVKYENPGRKKITKTYAVPK